MGIKISALPNAASVQTGDVLPLVQNGVTKQATVEQIRGEVPTNGTWTPAVNCISSPTAASGWYQKIGNVVTIGWFITGSVDSIISTAIRITGIPFTPDSSVRWYGGGGNVTALSTAAYDAFCGYTLDTASNNEILIRTAPTGTTAGVRTSGYVTANSAAQGNTAFITGTLTYMTND